MLIPITQYFETLNRDHQGNPLITVFPSLKLETIAALMSNAATSATCRSGPLVATMPGCVT